MATNFIITGDLHYRLQNPKARLDDYLEALDTKISEVIELAHKYNADIIIPGDIFDSPNISLPGIAKLARHIQKNNEELWLDEKRCWKGFIYTIPGNHDIYGHNLESISRTPYGLLSELGYIHDLHAYGGVGINGEIVLHGKGFNHSTDDSVMYYSFPENTGSSFVKILVTHGMLLKYPAPEGMKHTLLSELESIPENLRPNVLINGHYHFGLPLTWVGKTLVVNPGALGRLTAHVEEINREIKVTLLTINGPEDYSAKFIPLKSAQPGNVVLSREHIEQAEVRNERLETFLKLLGSESESRFMEVQEIVESVAKSDDLPKDVVDEALLRIGKAREIISGRG